MKKMARLSNDDILKLKAATLYVMSKFEDIDILRLFKILYFADKEHYAKYGRRIIPDTFHALPNGPVPTNLYDAIKIAQGKRERSMDPALSVIADAISVCGEGCLDYVIRLVEAPDMDELSKSDILCLDKSMNENAWLSFGKLSEKSHDLAYDEGKTNHRSRIRPIMMAKAAGASEDMLEYLSEKEALNAALA
jgi:hypothetical protein